MDDIVAEIKRAIEGNPTIENGVPTVPNVFKVTLGEIVDSIIQVQTVTSRSNIAEIR